MVTPEQVTLIKESWRKVVPIAHLAAGLFYRKLFELDPSLRPMFKGDMREKGEKLMQVIAVAVGGLDNLDEILPAVQELGVKHLEYGVKDSHYDTFGAALLWALGQVLGETYTPEVKSAWSDFHGMLATTMKDAARQAA